MRRSGELLGKVRVPELVANLAWGGPDFRTLFLTATHSVYACRDQGRAAQRALMGASTRRHRGFARRAATAPQAARPRPAPLVSRRI